MLNMKQPLATLMHGQYRATYAETLLLQPSGTNPDYWDCECARNFIHPKSVMQCPKCHCENTDERPDSIAAEVLMNTVRGQYDGIKVPGCVGTWHVCDDAHAYYKHIGWCHLLEEDTFGDEMECVIVNEDGQFLCEDHYDGFDALDELLETDEEFIAELKQKGIWK